MKPSAKPKPKGHFKMIGEGEVRKTRHQTNRTVHTKTKDMYHPARCMQPLKNIMKSSEILNRFIRATFKMTGQSGVRKTRHQNHRTVHTKTKEIWHPARCMRPPRKIAKSNKILNEFMRAIFEMIGRSEFRKKCL